MPTRINGIGTWYWGMNNIITRNGNCEFCGTYRALTSYDTTLFFTFVFVPILPLRRKRIIDQCSGCKRHRAIALSKWEQQKSDSLMKALEEWQANRSDAAKAKAAVGVTVAFHDRHAFEDLAPAVGQAFSRDPSMQLFLADAYDHFGQTDSAESAYRAALAQVNSPENRRALAKFFLRQSRPDEAKPLLDDIVVTKDRTGAPLILALAQAYQASGNHEAASRLMDDAGTAFPDLLSNAEFDRIRRTSQKYRGTNKPIKAATPTQYGGAREATWFQRNGAKTVVGLVLTIALVVYFAMAVALGNHRVYLVNGTSQPYVATINGQPHTVPANGNLAVDLDEGKLDVAVKDHPEIDPAQVTLATNFWTRPFKRRTFIINPDRTAVIDTHKVEYSTNPTPNFDEEYTLYVGQVLYSVAKPNDPFTEPPSSLKADSGSKIVRLALEQVTNVPLASLMLVVEHEVGPDGTREWMKRRAAFSNDSTETLELLSLLSMQSKPAEMIAFLRPHLGDRPVRVEWHRHYQELMQEQHPDYDLTGEYRALLAKDPQDSTMVYLLARTLADHTERQKMFAQAATGPKPCAYASYALAYEAMSEARYEDALAAVEKARQLDPQNMQFWWTQSQALEALGRFDEAVKLASEREKHSGDDHAMVSEEVRLLVSKGDPAAAQRRIELYCVELNGQQRRKEVVDAVRNSLDAIYAYARGDTAAYKAALKTAKNREGDFELAIVDRDYEAAEKALEARHNNDYADEFLLAALAVVNGNKGVSDRAWAKATAALAKGNHEERKLATILADASKANADSSIDLYLVRPDAGAAVLTAVAARYPQLRAGMLERATKANYSTRFPHRELADAIAKLKS